LMVMNEFLSLPAALAARQHKETLLTTGCRQASVPAASRT
jgi:hypothetical protein